MNADKIADKIAKGLVSNEEYQSETAMEDFLVELNEFHYKKNKFEVSELKPFIRSLSKANSYKLDGKKIEKLFSDGKIEEIGKYCDDRQYNS